MKRTNLFLNHKTGFNVLGFPLSLCTTPLNHFSKNSGATDNNKPWLNTRDRNLTRVFNQQIQEKYNTRIGGGFRGYTKTFVLPIIEESFKSPEPLKVMVQDFFAQLDDNLYSLLPVASYKNSSGSLVYKTLFKESVKISKDSRPGALANALYTSFIYIMEIYDLESIDDITLYHKVWVCEDDLQVSFKEASDILNKVFDRRLAENKIVNHVGGLEVSPSAMPKELGRLEKNPHLAPLFKAELIDYNKPELSNVYLSDYKMISKSEGYNKFTTSVIDSFGDELLSFQDSLGPESGILRRKHKNLELVFKNNKLDHTNVKVQMDMLLEMHRDMVPDYGEYFSMSGYHFF